MSTPPNYDDVYRTPEQSELTKVLRFIFTGVFVAAVFIVPSVTAVKFFIA
ncbi:MAG TPA: hypothetical protein PLJ70_09195 [Methylotenera sp.]|jgi:hypothetical protein|nr:hypothetical protein [Methylotenera sp.]